MANISTAQGTLEFSNKFYNDNQALIERYFNQSDKEEALIAAYGIYNLDSQGNGIINFNGSGRWSMENTLQWALIPDPDYVSPKIVIDNLKLVQSLFEANESIVVNYIDYEPGCQFLTEQRCELTIDTNNPTLFAEHIAQLIVNAEKDSKEIRFSEMPKFFVKVIEDYDCDYTDRNLIDLEVEEGYLLDIQEDRKIIVDKLQGYYSDCELPEIKHIKLNDFIKRIFYIIANDSDLNNAICEYRFDEFDEFVKVYFEISK